MSTRYAASMPRGFAALMWLLVAAPTPSAAEDSRVTVRLDGRAVMRVGASDSTTAVQRALRVERRLTVLLETPRAPRERSLEDSRDSGKSRAYAGEPPTPRRPAERATTSESPQCANLPANGSARRALRQPS